MKDQTSVAMHWTGIVHCIPEIQGLNLEAETSLSEVDCRRYVKAVQ
jgi:hypothetical protein